MGALQGVGEKIAERNIPKIFLLNGSHDRETSASKSTAGPMTACDVVLALCDALNRRHAKVLRHCIWLLCAFLHYLPACNFPIVGCHMRQCAWCAAMPI